jgi:hypothetical protein
MGRLLKNGFEVKFNREDGIKTVILPPGLCYKALWDPIDSVDGAKFQLLLDILGSDIEFYGRLFGTKHLAEYLSEPPKKFELMPIHHVEFRWQASSLHYEDCRTDGCFTLYLEARGVGSPDPAEFQGDPEADVGYALEFIPLPSLANYPVRICDLVECEKYGLNMKPSKSILGHMPIRLIDMLGALVEEASFHGGPEQREKRLEDLKCRMDEVDDVASGKVKEYMTLEELRVKLGLVDEEGQSERPPGLKTSEETKLAELREKVAMYEGLFHDLQMYAEVTLQEDKVIRLVKNVCRWSYAHRVGNGEHTEEEQDQVVRKAFERLREA